MLFNRLPSLTTLAEIFVIFMIGWWVFHDPAGAGHFVSGIFGGLKHAASQGLVFLQSA
jgi:hypothetical protein